MVDKQLKAQQMQKRLFMEEKKRIKVLKFGGKSLANGEGLNQVLSIVENKVKQGDRLALVVSAVVSLVPSSSR